VVTPRLLRHSSRLTSPRCVGEFEQVVDGADHRPLGSDLVEAAEEELAEAAGMFDLADTGSTICFRWR
jgi:hypothetical protein